MTVTAEADHDLATLLDRELRDAAAAAADGVAEVIRIMGEARRGSVHVTLGYKSWTAYLADALRPLHRQLDGSFRRELVQAMAENGMSQRAIARATGESKTMIQRELAAMGGQVVQPGPPDGVVGLDGKTYKRRSPVADEIDRLLARPVGRSERAEAFERFKREKYGPPELASLRQFLASATAAATSGLTKFGRVEEPELRSEGRAIVLQWIADYRVYLDEVETLWAATDQAVNT